jgi:hypothetical protein
LADSSATRVSNGSRAALLLYSRTDGEIINRLKAILPRIRSALPPALDLKGWRSHGGGKEKPLANK